MRLQINSFLGSPTLVSLINEGSLLLFYIVSPLLFCSQIYTFCTLFSFYSSSTFIDFTIFAPPPLLFTPPQLLER